MGAAALLHAPKLGLIDWLVCLAYLVVVFGLAIRSARGQRDNEDYFVGGRRMNWIAVGISMFATSFSSISFLGRFQRGLLWMRLAPICMCVQQSAQAHID